MSVMSDQLPPLSTRGGGGGGGGIPNTEGLPRSRGGPKRNDLDEIKNALRGVAAPSGRPQPPSWKGTLAKSRQPQCEVVCVGPDLTRPAAENVGGSSMLSSWAPAEPQGWPATLDVAQRMDVNYVCSTLFNQTPFENKTVLRIMAAPGGPQQGGEQGRLAAFSEYLWSKQRAGVVVLPAVAGVHKEMTVPERNLFLIPMCQETCDQLGVACALDPGEPCMLALVVPKS